MYLSPTTQALLASPLQSSTPLLPARYAQMVPGIYQMQQYNYKHSNEINVLNTSASGHWNPHLGQLLQQRPQSYMGLGRPIGPGTNSRVHMKEMGMSASPKSCYGNYRQWSKETDESYNFDDSGYIDSYTEPKVMHSVYLDEQLSFGPVDAEQLFRQKAYRYGICVDSPKIQKESGQDVFKQKASSYGIIVEDPHSKKNEQHLSVKLAENACAIPSFLDKYDCNHEYESVNIESKDKTALNELHKAHLPTVELLAKNIVQNVIEMAIAEVLSNNNLICKPKMYYKTEKHSNQFGNICAELDVHKSEQLYNGGLNELDIKRFQSGTNAEKVEHFHTQKKSFFQSFESMQKETQKDWAKGFTVKKERVPKEVSPLDFPLKSGTLVQPCMYPQMHTASVTSQTDFVRVSNKYTLTDKLKTKEMGSQVKISKVDVAVNTDDIYLNLDKANLRNQSIMTLAATVKDAFVQTENELMKNSNVPLSKMNEASSFKMKEFCDEETKVSAGINDQNFNANNTTSLTDSYFTEQAVGIEPSSLLPLSVRNSVANHNGKESPLSNFSESSLFNKHLSLQNHQANSELVNGLTSSFFSEDLHKNYQCPNPYTGRCQQQKSWKNVCDSTLDSNLYCLVVSKLRQFYPSLANFPEMLHTVAMQQTAALQYYMTDNAHNQEAKTESQEESARPITKLSQSPPYKTNNFNFSLSPSLSSPNASRTDIVYTKTDNYMMTGFDKERISHPWISSSRVSVGNTETSQVFPVSPTLHENNLKVKKIPLMDPNTTQEFSSENCRFSEIGIYNKDNIQPLPTQQKQVVDNGDLVFSNVAYTPKTSTTEWSFDLQHNDKAVPDINLPPLKQQIEESKTSSSYRTSQLKLDSKTIESPWHVSSGDCSAAGAQLYQDSKKDSLRIPAHTESIKQDIKNTAANFNSAGDYIYQSSLKYNLNGWDESFSSQMTDSPEESWQQVVKKKKREHAQEPINKSQQTKSDADTRKSNYERLVQVMQERLPNIERCKVDDLIREVRRRKNGLSGLTMREIVMEAKEILLEKTKTSVSKEPEEKKHKIAAAQNRHVSTSKQQYEKVDKSKQSKIKTLQNSWSYVKRVHRNGSAKDEICTICIENLYLRPRRRLDCGHDFHEECIRSWVFGHERSCPTCRQLTLFPEEFPKLT